MLSPQSITPSLKHSRYRSLPYGIRNLLIFLVTGIAVGGALGVTLATHAATTTCPVQDIQYRVQAGDTLNTIAARYGTIYQVLAKESQIAMPNLIFTNQLVCIPPSAMKKVVNMPITGMAPTVPMPVLPKSSFVATARLDATAANIPVQIFLNQINQESGFNPNAVSSAGALGIAQFLPSTAAGLGINPRDPNQSLRGASQLMASYIMMSNGDISMALADYNAGTGNVASAVRRCGKTAFRACLPLETQQYIHIITGN